MPLHRREFVKGGVAAFTVGFAAPEFLSDLAVAQGQSRRNLVVLYLSGGNDALSTLIPYTDPQDYARRPALQIPAGNVLQIGTDASAVALGLEPASYRTADDLQRRTSRDHPAHRIPELQPVALPGNRHLVDGRSVVAAGNRMAWPVSRHAAVAGRSVDGVVNGPRDAAHAAGADGRRAVDPERRAVRVRQPERRNARCAVRTRQSAMRIASHLPIDQPHLAFVNAPRRRRSRRSIASLTWRPTDRRSPIPNNGLGSGAAGGGRRDGPRYRDARVLGPDRRLRHPRWAEHEYRERVRTTTLMTTLNGALSAFYTDLQNQGLFNDTLVLQFSEFGRRITENGSAGTDHGAAGLMFAMGGAVRGGLYGTAANLRATPDNPTLENNGNDVRHETDFRSVYATVIDRWLGADSTVVLGQNFRGGPGFLS